MPLPTPTNLPFQPFAGSQTSTLMSESLVGVSVACTRQNSGRLPYAPAPTPGGAPGLAGCRNAPGATTSAAVTLPPGSAICASAPHSAAAAGAAHPISAVPAAPLSKVLVQICFGIVALSPSLVCRLS